MVVQDFPCVFFEVVPEVVTALDGGFFLFVLMVLPAVVLVVLLHRN